MKSAGANGLRKHLKFADTVTLTKFSQSGNTTTSTLAFLNKTQASVKDDVNCLALIGFMEENLTSIDLNPFQGKVDVQYQTR